VEICVVAGYVGAGLYPLEAGQVPARTRTKLFLVEKLVIENRSGQSERVFGILDGVLYANQSSLAKNSAIFLSGDLFRHIENHFHQRIGRELLRPMKHDSRLADVLNDSHVPGAEILAAITDCSIDLEAPRARNPRGLPLSAPAAHRGRVSQRFFHPASTTHGFPVILIGGSAQQADLVILSAGRPAGP
jgi:hypothetical protein